MTRSTASCLLPVLVAAALSAAACGSKAPLLPPGTTSPDEFLFTRGGEEMKERRWIKAREYYRQIVDHYPQSPYRPDAKLAVGDTYIGENSTESLILAATEFREFLTYYPTNPRADYAQFRLAYSFSRQMLAPERDQTATRETVRELQAFVERYPNSPLLSEATTLLRSARDRLSDAGFKVGLHYFRVKWYPGAIDRFREVLDTDPGYTRRDAVYHYLAESLLRTDKKAEALPYFERLVREFEQSEHLENARKRVAELKTETPPIGR